MSQNSSGGLGLSTVLGVVFIVLKLCGVITWSWWWVLSPFWIGLALILLVVGLLILVFGLDKLIDLLPDSGKK